MTDALLNLPSHLSKRLASALDSGLIASPFSGASLRSVLGTGEPIEGIAGALEELGRLGEIEPEIVDLAIQRLWHEFPDLYRKIVTNAYLDEKINLGKAAELLSVTRAELEQEFTKKGVPVRRLSMDDLHAEVDAIRQW